ncbi:MAG: hypothetical protein M1820_008935 [Bogoriella megaspora]|nr:MAG: hypothetical protein M1820_008935 [Bogoriella megaspora]
MGMLTFSKPFGFLETGEDWNNALHQIRVAGDSVAWVGQYPWLYALCQRTIFPIFGNQFALADRNGAVREFAANHCQIRQDEGAYAQPDIMQKLLYTHDKYPTDFDDDAVQSMAATNVFGGTETTASSIRARRVKQAAGRDRQNVSRALLAYRNSHPLRLADTMPYLHAVIHESMRLFPALGQPLARVAPSEGVEISGHFFPAGTQLTVYEWSLHRDKTIFGEDAYEFRPERWLDTERARRMHRCFFSFGSGARTCLGRNLAWMEMLKVVSTLFRHYEVELVDPGAEWVIEGGFIKGQRDINVVLKHRLDYCEHMENQN